MWEAITSAISGIVSPITNLVQRRAELAAQSHQLQLQINDAQAKRQIDLISQGKADDAAWEAQSLQLGKQYRGFELYMLSIPMILCFIPGGAVLVHEGFVAISNTPKWYQLAFLTLLFANYGYRFWRGNQSDT
ncbi:MAG: hypothetical protein KGL39_08885 [Patescibacteria group bacterium]|nr:hypothetical protein [Patescibacteria group bacterium]